MRISDMESNALEALGADNILKELLGGRADSQDAKQQMYSEISTYGYATLSSLPNDIEHKTALKTTSYFLTAAGIENDLLDPDLLNNTVEI